jgi:hypothetical protein
MSPTGRNCSRTKARSRAGRSCVLYEDIAVGGVFVAPHDGVGRYGTVVRTMLLRADALAAVGREQMDGSRRRAADRWVGLDRHGHQADA